MKRLVRAALDDLIPSGGPMPGIIDAGWDDFVDQYKREASTQLWLGVVAGAVVYTVTPILTVRRPVLSYQLPPDLRDTHADRVTNHRFYLVRQAVFLLKLSAGFAWGADAGVRSKINLPPYESDPGTWRS